MPVQKEKRGKSLPLFLCLLTSTILTAAAKVESVKKKSWLQLTKLTVNQTRLKAVYFPVVVLISNSNWTLQK